MLTCLQGAGQQARQEWQRTGQNGAALHPMECAPALASCCPALTALSAALLHFWTLYHHTSIEHKLPPLVAVKCLPVTADMHTKLCACLSGEAACTHAIVHVVT